MTDGSIRVAYSYNSNSATLTIWSVATVELDSTADFNGVYITVNDTVKYSIGMLNMIVTGFDKYFNPVYIPAGNISNTTQIELMPYGVEPLCHIQGPFIIYVHENA